MENKPLCCERGIQSVTDRNGFLYVRLSKGWHVRKRHIPLSQDRHASFPCTTNEFHSAQQHSQIILASGFSPCFCATLSVVSTRAHAPSFRVLALAAVTVPVHKHQLEVYLHILWHVTFKKTLEQANTWGKCAATDCIFVTVEHFQTQQLSNTGKMAVHFNPSSLFFQRTTGLKVLQNWQSFFSAPILGKQSRQWKFYANRTWSVWISIFSSHSEDTVVMFCQTMDIFICWPKRCTFSQKASKVNLHSPQRIFDRSYVKADYKRALVRKVNCETVTKLDKCSAPFVTKQPCSMEESAHHPSGILYVMTWISRSWLFCILHLQTPPRHLKNHNIASKSDWWSEPSKHSSLSDGILNTQCNFTSRTFLLLYRQRHNLFLEDAFFGSSLTFLVAVDTVLVLFLPADLHHSGRVLRTVTLMWQKECLSALNSVRLDTHQLAGGGMSADRCTRRLSWLQYPHTRTDVRVNKITARRGWDFGLLVLRDHWSSQIKFTLASVRIFNGIWHLERRTCGNMHWPLEGQKQDIVRLISTEHDAYHVEFVVNISEAVVDDSVYEMDSSVRRYSTLHVVRHVGHAFHSSSHHYVLPESNEWKENYNTVPAEKTKASKKIIFLWSC